MLRISKKFKSKNLKIFQEKLLIWSNNFPTSTFLNSNNYNTNIGEYKCICASEIFTSLPFTKEDSTSKLDKYIDQVNDWVFGYISYDLKNEIESLNSINDQNFNIPNLYFFQPKKIWIVYDTYIEALYLDSNQIDSDWLDINELDLNSKPDNHFIPKLKQTLNK